MPPALRRIPEPIVATAALLALIAGAWLLPGPASGFGKTPGSILFGGIVDGLIVSMITVGIVLVYSTVRIINFAQTALGVAAAVLCFDLMQLSGLPFPVAFLIGLGGGLALGAAFQLIFGTRFAKAPRVVLTLVAVFAGTAISTTAAGFVDQFPFLPPANLRPLDITNGTAKLGPYLPFPHWKFSFSNYPVPFGFAQVFGLVVSIAVIAGLAAFLRYTRLGKALRATAENSERAGLLGISVGLMALIVWTLAGGLSATAAMLEGFEYTPSAVAAPGPITLLIPVTAAVLAKMRNLWTAVALTVGLIVISEALGFQNPAANSLFDLGLFALLIGGMLLRGRGLSRTGEESSSWAATSEIRPVPKEMSGLLLLRVVKWGAVAVALIALAVAPVFLSIGALQELGVILLTGVISISVVILTGWAGQASAGQYAIAAVGAVFSAWLSAKVGITPWLAIPVATLVAVAVGSVLAFPALRIRGLFLLALTFAFAIVARSMLFDPNYAGWLQPQGLVKRPTFFVVDLADDRFMYAFAVVVLLVAITIARNLRRSRFGRLVIAGRENEANLEASGISAVRTKVAAFAAAGAFAGLAGALLAYEQFGVNGSSFDPSQSLQVFEMAIVGGVSSVYGGLLGTAVIYGLNLIAQQVPGVATFLPIVPLLILYITPSGLLGAGARLRDALLRIIAQRSKMIVPSLYGDLSPEALERRLIPLAPAVAEGGAQPFRLATSRLSLLRGGSAAGRSREAAAIGAATLGLSEADPEAAPA